MKRALLAALGAALALGAAAPAGAQSLNAYAGDWVVETSPHAVTGCVIAGRATAQPGASAATLAITLEVNETCPNGAAWQASERCNGALKTDRTPAQLIVRCALLSSSTPDYRADHFFFDEISPSALTGRLIDGGIWDEPVRWRRPSPALVS